MLLQEVMVGVVGVDSVSWVRHLRSGKEFLLLNPDTLSSFLCLAYLHFSQCRGK